MRAEVVRMTEQQLDKGALRRAGGILRAGGLVAFPTETVYGLGGNALDPSASEKIYAAKGRPSDNPLIVHIADLAKLSEVAACVPEAAVRLAAQCWPGPLTMIFEKTPMVPYATTGGLDTVAVRFPSHKIAQALILAAGGFVAAPSANTSGRPSPTRATHVIEDLGDKIDMIIDGGPVDIGLESTIVDFTEEVPVILRPGFYSQNMLSALLGEVRMDPGLASENAHVRPKAPGMRYRHYAPRADLTIVEGDQAAVEATIRALAQRHLAAGERVGVICTEESRAAYPAGDVRCIGSRADDRTIAHALFDVLRAFDDDGVAYIYTEAFDTPQMGQAIMNRLLKAAGHKVLRA